MSDLLQGRSGAGQVGPSPPWPQDPSHQVPVSAPGHPSPQAAWSAVPLGLRAAASSPGPRHAQLSAFPAQTSQGELGNPRRTLSPTRKLRQGRQCHACFPKVFGQK